jgi:CRISPR/Cas system CSM-associated protein Csm4 (group 5 of RAMP superfamily)
MKGEKSMKEITKLNDEELKERADALATTCEQIAELEAEKAEITKDFKQRIDALEKERARLARVVRTQLEERETEQPLLKFAGVSD